MNRFLPALTLLASLTTSLLGCDDPPPRRRGQATHSQGTIAPVAIGHEDGGITQVYFPLREVPPTLSPTPVALGPAAALARTSDGGAMLVWSSLMPSPRTVSQIAMRRVNPDATLGPIWEVRRTPGIVKGIDAAIRGNDGLLVFSADLARSAAVSQGVRFRPDGTLVGGPISFGMYRVADDTRADASAPLDRLGFPVRIVPSQAGFSLAIRGAIARCGDVSCPSVRLVDVDLHNVMHGRGGVTGVDADPVVALLGSESIPASIAATFRNRSGDGRIDTFGRGPLAQLPANDGSLLAAWLHAGTVRALIRQNTTTHALGLLGEAAAPAGRIPPVQTVTRVAVECAGGQAATRLETASGPVHVRVDEVGGSDLLTWAMNNALPRAHRSEDSPRDPNTVSDVVNVNAGLVIARGDRIEVARCNGDALDTPVGIAWVSDAAGDAPAAH